MKKSIKHRIKPQNSIFTVLMLIPIIWSACLNLVSWPSAKSDLASFLAGMFADHQYGENLIIYGIGNISNYLYGSLILSFAIILFFLIWIGVDFLVAYLLIKEIWKKLLSLFKKDVLPPAKQSTSKGKKKQTPERWTRKILERSKNFSWNIWLVFILLIVFILPFFLLPSEWEKVTENWELARPNPENDYQIRPKTLRGTSSLDHHSRGKYSYSYTEYFIKFDSALPEFEILNNGVLENSYHTLQEGQTVYTIVEIQPNGKERIFYADDNLKEVEKVLENYLEQ